MALFLVGVSYQKAGLAWWLIDPLFRESNDKKDSNNNGRQPAVCPEYGMRPVQPGLSRAQR